MARYQFFTTRQHLMKFTGCAIQRHNAFQWLHNTFLYYCTSIKHFIGVTGKAIVIIISQWVYSDAVSWCRFTLKWKRLIHRVVWKYSLSDCFLVNLGLSCLSRQFSQYYSQSRGGLPFQMMARFLCLLKFLLLPGICLLYCVFPLSGGCSDDVIPACF